MYVPSFTYPMFIVVIGDTCPMIMAAGAAVTATPCRISRWAVEGPGVAVERDSGSMVAEDAGSVGRAAARRRRRAIADAIAARMLKGRRYRGGCR